MIANETKLTELNKAQIQAVITNTAGECFWGKSLWLELDDNFAIINDYSTYHIFAAPQTATVADLKRAINFIGN